MADIIAYVPCRAGSERVKHKNTRPFAGYEKGLIEVKLNQLCQVDRLSKIIVSSNDPAILDYSAWFKSNVDARVDPRPRPDEYGSGSTSMEAFIRDQIATAETDGVMMMTHVTHPLVKPEHYVQAINAYEQAVRDGHDSLVSVTELRRFLWRNGKPFNYDNSVEKWPRSQDIEVVHELNHAIYLMPFALMREVGDRIGHNPLMYPMPEDVAMDIDWQEQFDFLQDLVNLRKVKGETLF